MKLAKISSSCRFELGEIRMLEDPKVLIVDDDSETRKLLQAILTSYEMEVTLCENATEALLSVMGGTYDYIIIDYRMPGMNGIELVRRLREILPPMTVIIGMSSEDISRQFLLAGANDFVLKPFVPYNVAMMIDGRDMLL